MTFEPDQPGHGIRIGAATADGPLCICGQWGCEQLLGNLNRKTGRLINVLQLILLWVMLVTLSVAGIWAWRWLT